MKDTFNGLEPTGDGAALGFVTNPTVPPLLEALFGLKTPPTPRNDLVTIFLTGIPGLNQIGTSPRPSEMIRLNMAVPPSSNPNRLGLLGGDTAGFPNGRRPADDVVDIELRALAGGTPFTPAFNVSPNNALGDGVDHNDTPFFSGFPYLQRRIRATRSAGRVSLESGLDEPESGVAESLAMSTRQRIMFVVAAIAIGAVAAAIYLEEAGDGFNLRRSWPRPER